MRARLAAAGLTILAAAGIAVAPWWVARPLPPDVLRPPVTPGFTLQDRYGLTLRATRASDGSRRRWRPLEAIDPDLLAAFLAAEDRRFFEHGAVDWRGVARAGWTDLRARRIVSGASTITMQLARLVHPVPRSWSGKLAQVLWAYRLEHHLTKAQILEQYLARVPLGQAAVGVEAAAGLYFGADAGDLSLGQAALLAGLARAPAGADPFVRPAQARARRAEVLRRLGHAGYADAPTLARAGREPLVAAPGGAPFLAPHFTSRVVAAVERELARADETPAAGTSGTWRTSLDAQLQAAVEGEVRHTVDQLRDRGVRQAAVVVLDNPTGEVLAWVGSPDFWADTAGQVDMVASPRQPGSALKPFLYGLAFDHGYTPASILPDIAQVYRTGGGPYAPRNYDRRFHGPVRAREALASSFNLPAVALANALSVAGLLDVLHDAGFASLSRRPDYYGLGLALGNGDVTLVELANGYRAIASGGRWRPWRWWNSPGATEGAEAAEGAGGGRRVMSPRAAALVLDVLSDPVARIPGFGVESALDFPFQVAAKTGTSRHFTDNWAVGTTAGFTVAVWVGNFDGRAMDGVSGVTGAGPLLHRSVLLVAQRYAPGALPSPASQGAERVEICRLSGLRAGPRCPHATEWFAPGTAPMRDCDWHTPDGVRLPAEYAEWAGTQQDGGTAARREGAPPQEALPPYGATSRRAASPAVPPVFRIASPRTGDVYRVPPGVDPRYATLTLRAAGEVTRWTVDGRAVPSARWPLAVGIHEIVAAGRGGARDTVQIEVRP